MTYHAASPTEETPLIELSAELLRARVARAQLYLIEMRRDQDAHRHESFERDHLAYLYKLEIEGRLYGGGPVDASAGLNGYDLAIIAAASRQEAELIASNEPFRKAGLGENSVFSHTMNEGVACYVGRAMSRRLEQNGDSFDPDMGSILQSYDELIARKVGAQLFLVRLEPTEKARPADDTQSGQAHFVWLREHEMAARLMSCGPVQSPEPLRPGIWGEGLGVLAASPHAAEQIAAAEPSGQAGYRRISLRGWTLNFGLAAPIAKALQSLNALPPIRPEV